MQGSRCHTSWSGPQPASTSTSPHAASSRACCLASPARCAIARSCRAASRCVFRCTCARRRSSSDETTCRPACCEASHKSSSLSGAIMLPAPETIKPCFAPVRALGAAAVRPDSCRVMDFRKHPWVSEARGPNMLISHVSRTVTRSAPQIRLQLASVHPARKAHDGQRRQSCHTPMQPRCQRHTSQAGVGRAGGCAAGARVNVAALLLSVRASGYLGCAVRICTAESCHCQLRA